MPSHPVNSTPDAAWVLTPLVHATTVEDDVVFLNLRADDYFCLPAAAAQVRLRDDRWGLDIVDETLAADLFAAGFIAAREPDRALPARQSALVAVRSAIRDSYPLPEPSDALALVRSSLDVAMRYRGRSFAEIVGRARPDRTANSEPGALCDAVDAFHRWVPFAPVSGKCLLRSFMLRQLLDRRGLPHDWVFGVATWPFQAHCWLQVDDLVLDDTFEHVSGYRPIMVI